jgi:hypothetical protein
MLKQKIKNTNLISKNYKQCKINYQYINLKNHLLNNNLLIFFYDFISESNSKNLNNYLITNKLKSFKLKKNIFLNLFNNVKYNSLQNILKNNILLISSNTQNTFTLQNLKDFKAISNIFLLAI